MSRTTLNAPVILQAISEVNHAAVDIDEHPDLAAKYNVAAVPTFVMLATAYDESDRTTGFKTADDFLPWLTNGVSAARLALAQHVVARKSLAEIDRLLAATNVDAARQAVAKLFPLCDDREPAIAQTAVDRLKTIATRDPAGLLDGLNDPRLITRIQVANALRSRIGDEFDIDPWADAAARQKSILVWREKLREGAHSSSVR